MTDIFISYDSDDRARIEPLTNILKAEGWSVWWDRDLVVGPRFDEEVEKALNQASCVVVAWSRHSIKSRWVRDEADIGLERDALIPLLIDDVQPPLGFRAPQTAKLVGWPEKTGELDRLIAGIHMLLDKLRPTSSIVAYQLYKQGMERASGYNKWDTNSAIEMLRHATDLDPEFADAWAHLAEASLNSAVFFGSDDSSLLDQAEQAVTKALFFDPENITAKTIYGRLLWTADTGYKSREALHSLEDVIRLRTDAYQARIWQCGIFLHVGLSLEAKHRLEAMINIVEIDPLAHFFLGQACLYLGQHGQALEHHSRALALDPTNQVISLHYPGTWIHANELNQADASIQNARKIGADDPVLSSCEALLWAKRGEESKALDACRRTLDELKTNRSRIHTHHSFHHLGSAFALVGKPEAAIEQIRNAIKSGLPSYTLFNTDQHLHALHQEPEFDDLLSELKNEFKTYQSEFGDPL